MQKEASRYPREDTYLPTMVYPPPGYMYTLLPPWVHLSHTQSRYRTVFEAPL